jgi:hypothetical protein
MDIRFAFAVEYVGSRVDIFEVILDDEDGARAMVAQYLREHDELDHVVDIELVDRVPTTLDFGGGVRKTTEADVRKWRTQPAQAQVVIDRKRGEDDALKFFVKHGWLDIHPNTNFMVPSDGSDRSYGFVMAWNKTFNTLEEEGTGELILIGTKFRIVRAGRF